MVEKKLSDNYAESEKIVDFLISKYKKFTDNEIIFENGQIIYE